MKIDNNKKGDAAGTIVVGMTLAILIVLAILSAVFVKTDVPMAISRITGDYTEVSLHVISPEIEKGYPQAVQYSIINFGGERSLCGFVELWSDSSLQDSRYFCISNTNNNNKDFTSLIENVTIAGLSSGRHNLTLRHSLHATRSVDIDDEKLASYRDCPDMDKDGYGRYYDIDMNNAFIPLIKFTPCDVKTEFPKYRDEYSYPASLISYALSIDPSFEYQELTRALYIAPDGTIEVEEEEEKSTPVGVWVAFGAVVLFGACALIVGIFLIMRRR
jgi:hypothetical protein